MRWCAALMSIALVLAACDGDDVDKPQPTTSPAATAEATTVPTPDTSDVIALRFLEPAPLPEDLAITVATGCWQCDGPTTGFVRLRRLPDGSLEERTLFDPSDYEGVVNGYTFDSAAGTATIAMCTGSCRDQIGEAATKTHESLDGGVSYAPGRSFEGWRWLEGASEDGAVFIGPTAAEDAPVPTYDAAGNPIAAPSDGVNPYPLPREILWDSNGRSTLRDAANTVLLTSVGDQIGIVSPLDADGRVLAITFYRAEAPWNGYRLSIRRRSADALTHERTYGGFIHVGPVIDECRFFGNTDLPEGTMPTPDTGGAGFTNFLPVIIDWCEGTATPIVEPFTREPYLNGRNFVVALQRGPFVSVAEDVGDCLNVRAEPSLSAGLLGCFVAGVLLRDLDETREGEGMTWRRVATPSGEEGWASEEFLAP